MDIMEMLSRMLGGEDASQVHIPPEKREAFGEALADDLAKRMREFSDDPEAADKPLCIGCQMIGIGELAKALAVRLGDKHPSAFVYALGESLIDEAKRMRKVAKRTAKEGGPHDY